jgi:phosphatidylserine/phosphatidylglycerophosphate/cardiolipin synthase-like enzyme
MLRFIILTILIFISPLLHAQTLLPCEVEIYFSPKGGCTNAIIEKIGAAKKSVFVQAYTFTSEPIAKAFIDAHKRGTKVIVILDKIQKSQPYSWANFIAHAGAPTRIDTKHVVEHDKIIIIDEDTVITGSLNYTKGSEEKNAENIVILHSKEVAEKYFKNWQAHYEHSIDYVASDK